MFHGMWKENIDAIAGTNFFGGLWLLIPGEPMLIWARMGFVLVQALTAYFSFRILKMYFNRTKAFALVLFMTISIFPEYYLFVINRFNLPGLLLTGGLYYSIKWLKTKRKKDLLLWTSLYLTCSLSNIVYFPAVIISIALLPALKKVSPAHTYGYMNLIILNLLTFSILISLFICIGTDYVNLIRSGLPVFIAGVLILSFSSIEFSNRKKLFVSEAIFYTIPVFLMIAYVTGDFRYQNDLEYNEIQTDFRTPALFGVRSNKARTIVVDELFEFLSAIKDLSGKSKIFTNNNAIMYYLTDTNYSVTSLWDSTIEPDQLKEEINNEKPDLIVLPKTSHRDDTWPYSNDETEKIRYKKYYDVYLGYVKENNYIEVYRNYFYTVYSLNDVHR